MSSQETKYSVFKVRTRLAMQDPDMEGFRFHTVIFVETNAEGPGTGTKHHVTGDIVSGMHYESTPCQDPDTFEDLRSKVLIGHTDPSKYPDEWESLLRDIPPPPKQKAFNTKTMKTEPVKVWDPLTFYEPGEPRRPLMKCTEWIEIHAIPALRRHRLLRTSTWPIAKALETSSDSREETSTV